MISTSAVRADFPILDSGILYFDNACTSLKPRAVVDTQSEYCLQYSGCAGRSMHRIGKLAEEKTEEAREKIARFVNARSSGLVFTKNTTEALNLVAGSLQSETSRSRANIVTTILEHHSLYLPLQARAQRYGIEIRIVRPDESGRFSLESFEEAMDNNTELVAIHAVNNTLGNALPIQQIATLGHDNGACVLVDGAQSVAHIPTNFQKDGADFLAFSGHKMLGPTGIGCLAGRPEALEKLHPFMVGGGTVETVTIGNARYREIPSRFEAGIQNYAGIVGLGAAVDYLKKIGMDNVVQHEQELLGYLQSEISEDARLAIYGRWEDKRSAIFTFNLPGIPPHQVCLMLDRMQRICTRSGVFCAEPAMQFLGAPAGAVRASFYLYNTLTEIDFFVDTLRTITKTLVVSKR